MQLSLEFFFFGKSTINENTMNSFYPYSPHSSKKKKSWHQIYPSFVKFKTKQKKSHSSLYNMTHKLPFYLADATPS